MLPVCAWSARVMMVAGLLSEPLVDVYLKFLGGRLPPEYGAGCRV